MSYSTVLGVIPDQRPIDLLELSNGHGWSSSIWKRMVKANFGFDGYLFHGEGERHLDDLRKMIEKLPERQQAPLELTFDTGVVPFQAYEWAADQLDEFEKRLPEDERYVNHVPAVAALLRSKPEAPLIGVHGTSVGENSFDPWDYEKDEPGNGIPLDQMYLLRQHRHWFPDYRKNWAPDAVG